MELRKQGIASGATIIDGYIWNGSFIPADAIPNYVYWEFQGHEEYGADQLGFVNDSGFEIELVSLLGGSYEGGQTGEIEIGQIRVTTKAKNPNNYPDNIVFQQQPNAKLPYSFPKGFVLPIGGKVIIGLSSSIAYLRCVAKPCLPVLLGQINSTP